MKEFEIEKEQSEYLATLFHNKSMLIVGSAGTGKSILALEAIKRQIKENSESKILYLCSNAPFKLQIGKILDSVRDISRENIDVDTFSNYFGLSFYSSLRKNREKVVEHANVLYQYSLIIIDEAQELQSELLYDVKILANKSRFYIFGDEEQRIQNQHDDSQENNWKNNLEISNPIKLKKNYRNPNNIVSLAQRLLPDDYEQFPAREGNAIIYVKYVDSVNDLRSEILKFKASHEKLQVITILPDNWNKHSSILNKLSYNDVLDWLTVKQALGIENENVVVVVEGLFESKLSSFLYTAITRTLGDLKIIFYCGRDIFGSKCIDKSIKKFKRSNLAKICAEFQTEDKGDI